MSDTPEKKKYISRRFQRFIAIGYVMSEPELKFMRPREGEAEGQPFCTFMASTGSPYGESSDALFHVMLKGKNADLFCKEPRKGKEFLFDLQLKTYDVKKEGEKYPERRTLFVGSFSFVGPKQNAAGETASQPELPRAGTSPTTESKDDGDVPF